MKIDPKNADARYNKGSALAELGKDNEAIECYDRALKIDPNYINAWYNKGVVLGKLGKWNEAIECYDQALKIDPKNVLVIKNRDIVLERMEKEPDHYSNIRSTWRKKIEMEEDLQIDNGMNRT